MHMAHYKSSRPFSQAGETAFPNCGSGGCHIAGMFLLDLPRGLGEGEVSSGSLSTWGFGMGVGINAGLGTTLFRSDDGARMCRTGEPLTSRNAGSIGSDSGP